MEISKNYNNVVKFIEDKSIQEIDLLFEGFQYVANILKSFKYEFDSMSTNGWDLDLWIIYKTNNDTIMITGSMAFGILKLKKHYG